MSELGIVLCINSKNDETNALAGLKHPHSLLSPEDFAIIKANWEPKDHNLVEMAQALELGVDSFVFVDDNPVERGLVLSSLPQVAVPPLDRVENYIQLIDRSAYFESVNLTDEDKIRGKMYTANAKRKEEEHSFIDYGSYLASLDMRAHISCFTQERLPRITQLTNKTNQFNLTTQRYTETEMQALMNDPQAVCLCGTLADKYGDNGLVSVMAGKIEGDICYIVLWLMSCRVLKRNLEQAMMNTFIEQCSKKPEVKYIYGKYIPTVKNTMVKDLYKNLGFNFHKEEYDGITEWEMDITQYIPHITYIKIENLL
jgi:FkbH-like domain